MQESDDGVEQVDAADETGASDGASQLIRSVRRQHRVIRWSGDTNETPRGGDGIACR
jgi:hypothetical protein